MKEHTEFNNNETLVETAINEYQKFLTIIKIGKKYSNNTNAVSDFYKF